MKNLTSYSVPIKGLALGQHKFDFKVDQSFFDQYEHSQIKTALFEIAILIDRKEQMLDFDFNIKGELFTECDRCLNDIALPLTGQYQLMINLTDQTGVYEDDAVVDLSPETLDFDLSDHLYQMTHLCLPNPFIKNCDGLDEQQCDQDMIARLEGDDVLTDEETSDIWEQLRKIKFE